MKSFEYKKFIYLYFLWFASSSTASAFNLQEAWVAAQQHSIDYQIAFHQKNSIQEQQQRAKSVFFPRVSGDINYQYKPHSSSSVKQTQGWNIQLSQTLFNASEMSRYSQSRYDSEVAEQIYHSVKEKLLYNVTENYFKILLSNENIATYKAEKMSYEQQVEQAKALFNKGVATALDVHEAQAGYDNALAQETSAILKKQILENQFNDYTGLDVKEIEMVNISNLIERYLLRISQHSLEEWQNMALENNHEYKAQKYDVSSKEEAIKVVKNKRWPVLVAQVDYQNNYHRSVSQDGGHQNFRTGTDASIQLRAKIPLLTGGELSSEMRESLNQYEAAKARLVASERQIKLAIRQAYTESNAAHYQILAQERALVSSQLKLKSTETGQKYGMRNRLEIIQARQAVAQAEQKLAEARYNFLIAYAALIRESGLGLEGNL
ncbi:TolC family protein [Moraxella bovis]|uniref:Outer membrane protein tolC n=1 Tax=Moraxella bovis TaxID=476 RepID=A0A1S9ZWG2_MORBO|nr:TolC family protein [Moraxella bovis]AWY21062.1 TolC family protein [Moraxella bovis]OOR87767.1 secretion protein [Moraxella bovis]UYZ67862.1 TolC family protein [Moraxella bovis]UYZ70237.1 TolC family protein [Moraxella bovis]UYZ73853.1 TolC family protein [Moraxella bovis]